MGLHPSPVPHAHFVTSSTHKTLRGPRGGLILCKEEFAKKVDSAIFPGLQGGPFMHIMAGKAVALAEAMTPEFKTYGEAVVRNAHALASTLMEHGLRVVSGGTDNHLMVVDFGKEGPSGKVVEAALAKANITVNKNTVPRETRSAFVTSGIRVGSPAVTTRGMGVAEMQRIGGHGRGGTQPERCGCPATGAAGCARLVLRVSRAGVEIAARMRGPALHGCWYKQYARQALRKTLEAAFKVAVCTHIRLP